MPHAPSSMLHAPRLFSRKMTLCAGQQAMWGRELTKLKLILISPAGDPALRRSLRSAAERLKKAGFGSR